MVLWQTKTYSVHQDAEVVGLERSTAALLQRQIGGIHGIGWLTAIDCDLGGSCELIGQLAKLVAIRSALVSMWGPSFLYC